MLCSDVFWRLRLVCRRTTGSLSAAPRIRQAYVEEQLGRCLMPKGRRILDAGCGDGAYALRFASIFPTSRITGVDIDVARIATGARSKAVLGTQNVEFTVMSLSRLAVGDPYDIAYCIDVLEHVPDDLAALRSLRGVLRTSGVLILHVPLLGQRHFFSWMVGHRQGDHVRDGYTKAGIEKLLSSAGFLVLDTRFTFGFFGALAADLDETCRRIRGGLRFLVLPLLAALVTIELSIANKKGGNGLLVLAKAVN